MKDFYIRFELIESHSYGEYIYAVSHDPDKLNGKKEIVKTFKDLETILIPQFALTEALDYIGKDKEMNRKLIAFVQSDFAKKKLLHFYDDRHHTWDWPFANSQAGLAMLYYGLGLTVRMDIYQDRRNRYCQSCELTVPTEKEVEAIKEGLESSIEYHNEWVRKNLLYSIPWIIYAIFAIYLMFIRPFTL